MSYTGRGEAETSDECGTNDHHSDAKLHFAPLHSVGQTLRKPRRLVHPILKSDAVTELRKIYAVCHSDALHLRPHLTPDIGCRQLHTRKQ